MPNQKRPVTKKPVKAASSTKTTQSAKKGKPKFKQTHKAKMARRRTITVCVAFLVIVAIIVGMVSCISSRNAKKDAAADASAKTTQTEETKTDALDDYIADMTLDEKILQMFIVSPETLTGASSVTQAGSTTQSALNSYPVGGVYFSASNMTSKDQFKEMVTSYQAYAQSAAGVPLFIAVSEEGGDNAPVANAIGTNTMSSAYSYADNENPATDVMNDTESVATSLAYLGVNLNLAPYADVGATSQTSTSTRSFSTDYETAGTLVSAAVKGYRNGGVGSVLKYFPAVGENISDGTTSSLPSTTKTLEELESEDVTTFAAGATAGATGIMVGHISVDDVEKGVPASLSQKVIQNIIRGGMKYDGLVMTSSMSDSIITTNYTVQKAVVAAVKAGNDIIFLPSNIADSLSAIKSAVEDGSIEESQIDASVKRILQAKIDLNIMSLDDGAISPVTTTSPLETTTATESASGVVGSDTATTVAATSVANSVATTANINTTVG